MSPAAAEFISPPQRQSKQEPFTPQNPNTHFPSTFGSFSINKLSEHNQSVFPNAADDGFACGLASPSGGSAVSSRSKTRLLKRRQLGFQRGKCSTSAPPQKELGLNSNQVNSVTSSNIPTGFSASTGDAMYGKFDNEGFVFGASKCGLKSYLNLEKKQSCNGGVGKLNDVGFVFGGDRVIYDSNSNPEYKGYSEDLGMSGGNEFQNGTGLNIDQVNNATSIYKFNSFGASIEDFMCGKLNSAASSVMPNFRAEKKQTCSVAVGRSNDEGFVFGADRSKVDLNSNPEHKESSEDGGKSGADDIGKSENVGILFGDHSNISNKSCLMSNLNMGKTQSSGMGQTSKDGYVFGVYESDPDSDCNESSAGMLHPGVNEFWESENAGFLFGKTTSTPLLHLSMENGQCGESKKKSGDKLNFSFGANNSGLITNSGSETRQSGAEEIAVSGKHGNLMQNSEFEEKESSENVEKLAFAGRGRMNLDFGKVDDLDFGFRGNWSALGTNSNGSKNESTENGGISVSIDYQKMKSGAQLGKFDKIHFVFGACPEASSSRSDFEKEKSNQGAGNLSFDDCGKMKLGIEVETQKAEAHDVFIFGSSSKKNASFNESTELGDDMNKVYTENAGSNSGFVDTYFDKLDPIVNSISTPLSGSSGNTASVSGTNTVSKLSDEMRKMTVDDLIKVESSYDTKNRNIDCSASSNPVFVFGNNKKSPDSCTGKSGTTSCDQKMNKSLCGDGNEGAVERTEEDIVGFVSSSDAACSFGEGARDVMPNKNNQHTKSWLGVSDEQIKLVNWEEKQATNTNNSSSNSPFVGIPTRSPFIFQAGLGISDDGPRDQLNDHPSRLDSEAHPMGRVEKEGNFSFTSTPLGVQTSAKNFRTSNGDPSCAFMVNLSPRLDKKFESSGKSRSHRDKRWKNSRGKLGRAFPESRNNHALKEDNMESPRSYSPMDFSPYQDNNCAPSTSNVTGSPHGKKEDLEAVSEGTANITEGDKKCGELDGEDFYCQNERVVNSSLEETQTECCNSNMKREESECKKQNQFCFASRAKDVGEIKFTFSASACTQDKFSATKRRTKKYRMKVVPAPNCTTASQKVDTASSSVQFPVEPHDIEGNLNIRDSEHEGNNEHDKHGSTAPTQKACQKWRIRGNQAYENGYLSKAEGFYTKGINSVPRSEASGCCIEPLVLCYSNRAAARMSLGRMTEALGDCMQAAALDPNFHKVQIRAANCHLAMGEVEVALQYFSKCLETGADICLDRRIVIEAANGLQKAQKVAKCVNQCAELIRQRTCNAAICALEVISGVLSISSYSEKLLEMKGEALLMLRRYEEVIQLCEQTLVFAEKNVATVAGDNNLHIVDGSTYNNSSIRLWRWHLMAKSYFHLGKLEAALDLIEKQELLRSSEGRCGSSIQESSISFAVTVRELLHHKNAGNEAFQSGRHIEAVEHYTAAVSSSIESRPFAAICFCNRAAAHQALGQISDAIADCSLAIALDQSYSKAVSRRATLHEKIRDYEQAASDLQIVISLLEKQLQEELTKVRRRLFSMEEKAKKGMSLDHYLILGIKQSDTASEIKKAYRKAALRHHPDKAGQFLAKSESGDDGNLWKEIADEVHKDADRLFKMIGEAYAVLSDPTKRSDYDLQEELRNEQKERNRSRGSRGSPEFYSSPSRATANGQYGQGYRYSYYRQW